MKTVIVPVALIVLAGGLAVLAAAFSGKLRRGKDFDERQQAIQGRGFMVGFTVMLVFSMAMVLAGAIRGRELRGGTVFAMQAAVFGIIAVTLLVKTLLGRRNRE